MNIFLVLFTTLTLASASRVYTADYSMSLHTTLVSKTSWALGRREPTLEASAVACATRCSEGLHETTFTTLPICRCAKELEAWEVGQNITCNSFQYVREVRECHAGLSSLPSGGEATETVYRLPAGASNVMDGTHCVGEWPYVATLENVASLAACNTACAEAPTCTSWAYMRVPKKCMLFTGIKSKSNMGSWVCGLML